MLTDLKSKIVLGTVQLGIPYGINNILGKPLHDESEKILSGAQAEGITTLDTAEVYGESQKIIGNFHRNQSDKFRVVTKLWKNKLSEHGYNIDACVESDLMELNVDTLDGFLFHSFSDFQEMSEIVPRLNNLVSKGKIDKIGVSVYTNEEIVTLLKNPDIDIIQLPFNLLDNTKQRGDLLKKAKDKGKEIHVRSIFLQGLFFMPIEKFNGRLSPLMKYIKRLQSIGIDFGISVHEMALLYPLFQTHIDHVLIGMESSSQLNENMQILSRPKSLDFLSAIDKIDVEELLLLNPNNWK